jgi:hypothetical protein
VLANLLVSWPSGLAAELALTALQLAAPLELMASPAE